MNPIKDLMDWTKRIFESVFIAIDGFISLSKDFREARRVDKKLKRLFCIMINDGFVEQYRGKLTNDTNKIEVPVLNRTFMRDRLYYDTRGNGIAFLHDSYPQSLDLDIFKIDKADMKKWQKDPKYVYKLVNRDFSIHAFTIGAGKLLENIIPTPRRTIMIMLLAAFLLGNVFNYYMIMYFLLK